MKKIKIHFFLTERELQKEMGRFGFTKEELPHVIFVHRRLQKNIQAEAFYELRQQYERSGGCQKEKDCEQGAKSDDYLVCVTLGDAPDRLQEEYQKKEQLLQAYITECLSMVYLSHAYEKAFAAMEVQERAQLSSFDFWENRYPVEALSQAVEPYASLTGIRCTQEGFLRPSKSVVLLVSLLNSDRSEKAPDQNEKTEQTVSTESNTSSYSDNLPYIDTPSGREVRNVQSRELWNGGRKGETWSRQQIIASMCARCKRKCARREGV